MSYLEPECAFKRLQEVQSLSLSETHNPKTLLASLSGVTQAILDLTRLSGQRDEEMTEPKATRLFSRDFKTNLGIYCFDVYADHLNNPETAGVTFWTGPADYRQRGYRELVRLPSEQVVKLLLDNKVGTWQTKQNMAGYGDSFASCCGSKPNGTDYKADIYFPFLRPAERPLSAAYDAKMYHKLLRAQIGRFLPIVLDSPATEN